MLVAKGFATAHLATVATAAHHKRTVDVASICLDIVATVFEMTSNFAFCQNGYGLLVGAHSIDCLCFRLLEGLNRNDRSLRPLRGLNGDTLLRKLEGSIYVVPARVHHRLVNHEVKKLNLR